jgi:hypothetical protein
MLDNLAMTSSTIKLYRFSTVGGNASSVFSRISKGYVGQRIVEKSVLTIVEI